MDAIGKAEQTRNGLTGEHSSNNGGPGLREWVDDPAATPADLEALAGPDEAAWCDMRRPFLLY